MKFLLVALNAKYIHSNPAIYSLRRYAGELAGYVELAEYTINNRMEEILEDIYDRKPNVIGFSCYIWNREMILELIPELHMMQNRFWKNIRLLRALWRGRARRPLRSCSPIM